MKLEYSDVKKTAGKLQFRTKAFVDGKFVNAALGELPEGRRAQAGKP